MAKYQKEASLALTAGITSEKFPSFGGKLSSRYLILVLVIICIGGFSMRVFDLGRESFGEDELNKFETVEHYIYGGLSGENGEHPFLMKGMQTVSVSIAHIYNNYGGVTTSQKITSEAALRFPTALIGTLTCLMIFLLIREFFGEATGLFAAAFWAFDPNAIGFDRIAKEDSFLLFFFLTGCYFWVRSQTLSEHENKNWARYLWAAGASFGAMLASKYLIHILAIPVAYYEVTEVISRRKWQIGKVRWFCFFLVLGVSFLVLNPTILLPETWHNILTFGTENRIAHDSYEFMGTLYRNKITLWFNGVPWYFYFVFIAVKTPLITLSFFLLGVLFLFQRKTGDGRIFLFFWAIMWFLPFSVIGGKFMRYFTVAQPLILIIAAIGCVYFSDTISTKLLGGKHRMQLATFFAAFVLASSILSSVKVAPDYRLFTNLPGGGTENAGFYFPHDEFYDSSTSNAVNAIATGTNAKIRVYSETPGLYKFYFENSGRNKIESVSLSDPQQLEKINAGDFIVFARGRRYFSNEKIVAYLSAEVIPFARINLGGIPSVTIYKLDEKTAEVVRKMPNAITKKPSN